jgi:hypothetical protein
MTSRDFCYWLQGFFEINAAGTTEKDNIDCGLTSAKVKMVRKHLALVFKHEIDPSMGDAEAQAKLNQIHDNPDGDFLVRC